MSKPAPVPSTDREHTDDSLRDERAKSDLAVVEGRDAVAELADDLLRRARQVADAVLLNARDQADERLQNSDAPPTAGAAAVKDIRIDAPADGPAIAAFDHSRMFQVLANLLVNAIKFTPRSGSIVIRCDTAGDRWPCSVQAVRRL